MKRLFFLIFISSLVIPSCKKKDKEPAPAQPTPAPTPVPGVRAVFQSAKLFIATGNSVTLTMPLNSGFLCSSDVINNSPTGPLLDIGDVTLNGVTFKKHLFMLNRYDDTTSNLNFTTPHVWTATGSSNMGAFTFTNNMPYPVYDGYASVASTFTISSGISIPLNSFSGADDIQVTIFRQSNTSKSTQMKFLSASSTSVQFTAQELAAVDTCNDATINIIFFKNNPQELNGKKCNFRTAYYFQKNGVTFK